MFTGADCKEYLVGMTILVILLIISFAIIVYLSYQNHLLKSSKQHNQTEQDNQSKVRTNSICENAGEDDGNYEEVENEESTYTALKRTGNEENDDHEYTHLNEVPADYVNEKETGF